MDWNRATGRSAGKRVLRWQAVTFGAILGFTMLVPRAGSATLLIPLSRDSATARLDAEVARGAQIAGTGPAGSVVLVNTAQGLALRALHGGMLALYFPDQFCTGKRTAHGRSG